MEKIMIPNYIKNNYCFNDTFQEMIENSIELRSQTLNEESIISLNNIFKKMDTRHQAIEESLQIMSTPTNSIKFWDNILESGNLNQQQKDSIKSIKAILEDASNNAAPTKNIKKEAIEGDGEDPNVDDNMSGDQGDQGDGQQTDDQGNPIDPNAEGSDGDPQMDQPQLDPEQVLQLELTQTNNKFVILSLYDKINELLDTIDVILETVSSSKTEENLELFDSLKLYQNYLYIISELIFVMDINTVYYTFTNISLEVNDLLDKYLISSKVKVLNDERSSHQEKKTALRDLKLNLSSKIEAKDEIQDEGNN